MKSHAKNTLNLHKQNILMYTSFLQVLHSKESASIYKPVILLLHLSFINMSLRTSISVSRVVWPLKVLEQNIHGLQGKYKGTNYELHVIMPCLKISQNFLCVSAIISQFGFL